MYIKKKYIKIVLPQGIQNENVSKPYRNLLQSVLQNTLDVFFQKLRNMSNG